MSNSLVKKKIKSLVLASVFASRCWTPNQRTRCWYVLRIHSEIQVSCSVIQVNNDSTYPMFQANFAKWEPWHGKFGFFYPWEKYLKIGDVLRELAAITLALGGCFQASETVGI